ncbi:MAG: ABC transporter ATP-binding protein [Leptospiraceae bacterium]|nr:ABC transporter ATP-binding protein [Leptospiraceae bacterium]
MQVSPEISSTGIPNAISVVNLEKWYGNFCALSSLSFSVGPGEIAALLGLNGAGKTTTIRVLTGFLVPTSGEVRINGAGYFEDSIEYRKKFGYLPERPALYDDMKVESYLKFMLQLRTENSGQEETLLENALLKTDLVSRRKSIIGTLSAGFKKRVGVAQAIIHDPDVLILDEPVSDLDPVQIVEIRNLLLELKERHTILVSSHILSEVSKTADRFLFIHQGKLAREETRSSINVDNIEKIFLETVQGSSEIPEKTASSVAAHGQKSNSYFRKWFN